MSEERMIRIPNCWDCPGRKVDFCMYVDETKYSPELRFETIKSLIPIWCPLELAPPKDWRNCYYIGRTGSCEPFHLSEEKKKVN
jgi:hypothetical protein